MFKKLSLVLASFLLISTVSAEEITGAGSSFVYPVMSRWAVSYEKATGTRVNYQSIGSGGGIKQIKAGTVQFGATDLPLDSSDLSKSGLIQFPIISGGIVPVINLKNISDTIVLSGEILSGIYSGKITKWNDPALVALNPNLSKITSSIAVIARSDSSGTTATFTNYLSKVSSSWKETIGMSPTVEWVNAIGAKGNEGVAALVSRTSGSIGYVEYAYAKQNGLVMANMINASGKTVVPSAKSFSEAVTHGNDIMITNSPGDNSWPIGGVTFILVSKNNTNILKFFEWIYKNGGEEANNLDYISIASSVYEPIITSWNLNSKK